MTTSLPYSTSRLAFSITISATWMWREAGSSKVDETTSPRTDRSMSVTSSGRSSISRTTSTTSGWFVAIELARDCRSIVLPVRGGATIRARWPLPIGVTRSVTRDDRSPATSSRSLSSGYSGVRLSKKIFCRTTSGCSKFTASSFSSAR